ncbi:crotonobetaine/carnitine-CoA ligase [soil metagenome]
MRGGETGTERLESFTALWDWSVARRGDAPFLVFEAPDGTVTDWSYREFDEVVGRTATLLVERGVERGAAVHLALTNCPMFVATWLATLRLGAWIVPSDPMATAPELAEHMVRTGAVVSVVSAARLDVAERAVDEVRSTGYDGHLTLVVTDEADARIDRLTGAPLGPERLAPPSPAYRAAVMFTSGTTGRPKGVEITQANYTFAGRTMAAAAGLTAEHRQLVVLPLFHANAQYYSFASAIAVGASVALMHTFSASGFVRQAAGHAATHASLFAGPMRMILARGGPLSDADRGAGLELRLGHCWFAQNLGDDQYETLADWFGCRPRQLYGMTETVPAVLTDSVHDPRPDTMGYVTAGCEVDVHDAAGRPCAADVEGEVVVRGAPGSTLFAGYLDDPDTTAASYRDGWFLTGDRATRDAHGRYRFAGRRSDVLKVAGENVSVVEVEAVLTAHPDVLEAVVVGAPDPIRDEVPVAFVVTAHGGVDPDTLVESLETWAVERLSKSKRPRTYTVVPELPRTSVGKIRKFLLTPEHTGGSST